MTKIKIEVDVFKYLLLTMVIEIPIYFFFSKKRIGYAILILILANCLTWPILNYLHLTTSINLWILEMGVVLVEAWIIYYYLIHQFSRAFLIALIQNILSTSIGLLIHQIK